ncbi:tail sheath protein [Pectobacterium phage PP101]|uniref:Tail sheath protein n=1 Tax=Pectobacterium phage PP101 TaxID=1916414 RepID=A0A1J0MF17_9CAUD|nr:tail sheath [Pectobacterium phage PP101]APD19720.1 tail sheath protein [Pectobacterium phage PP101]
MSIPISDLITVNIAVSPNAVATDGFGPLLFLSKEFVPVAGESVVRPYSSLTEVTNDFPAGEIQKAATAWYSQKPTPKTFLVGALQTVSGDLATAASVAATVPSVLADLKLITAGTLSFSLNGQPVNLSAIDLSSAASFDAIVTQINGEFTANNVAATMSHVSGTFKISSTATGSSATITAATGTGATNIGVAMKLTASSNPLVVQGADAASITTDLAAIANTSFNYFYVAVNKELRAKQDQKTVALWCEANGKVFGWADSDVKILQANTANSFAEAKAQNLRNTICVFDASVNGDEYPEISILARAATVNFNVANSVLILAFKTGPGIRTADLSSGQLAALRSYNGNAFIKVGDNTLFMDGKMADGTWFDTVQGVEWLTQKVRNNVFNLFYTSTTKIPWTETGIAMVNQQVTLALELAVTNGLIAAGYDNEGVFYPDGYKVLSTDLALLQSQKGARVWEGTSFIAIGSGALQGAVITGNFVQ